MSRKREGSCPSGRRRIQCKHCPWRKDVVTARDIPGGYSPEKHKALVDTIAEPGSMQPHGKRMACHESRPGAEFICVGWLHNQLGPGNNIPLRMQAFTGELPDYTVNGEQYESFEEMAVANGLRARPQITHEQLKLVRMMAWARGRDPDEAESAALEEYE